MERLEEVNSNTHMHVVHIHVQSCVHSEGGGMSALHNSRKFFMWVLFSHLVFVVGAAKIKPANFFSGKRKYLDHLSVDWLTNTVSLATHGSYESSN